VRIFAAELLPELHPTTWRTIAVMAYDEALAGRIRELLANEAGLTEQKMFGGLAFLIGGNMAVAASGQGGVLVRVDPEESDSIVASTSARPDGDAGSSDAGVAPRRTGGVADEATAHEVGHARRELREFASREAVA
jgi:hypothetical protein